MRLARSKVMENMRLGESVTVKKISKPEFLIYAKKELSTLFAEAVTHKSHEKFADILELVNSTMQVLDVDWYECAKIKSSKRWEEGNYDMFLIRENNSPDLKP